MRDRASLSRKGLSDVIVPAAVQAPHGIHLLVAAGEETGWGRGGFSRTSVHRGKAAAIGQQHVENQQIGGPRPAGRGLRGRRRGCRRRSPGPRRSGR